jgi:hypothetical protein
VNALATGEPTWELIFDEEGSAQELDRDEFFRELKKSGVEDLFIFSHGWNNDAAAARNLYEAMFPILAAASHDVDRLGPTGFVGVIWPSVWFPDTPARVQAPGGSLQANKGAHHDDASGSDTLSGEEIAESLVLSFQSDGDREAVREIGRLIDKGLASLVGGPEDWLTESEKEQLLGDIHAHAKSLARAATILASEDRGEAALFADLSPTKTYQGVAQTFGTIGGGSDTEARGDWFRRAIEGSKDMVRILSYTIMKARAGTVGSVGLGDLLADFPTRAPGVRVHLLGHSFGARLVSFALSTVGEPTTSPVHSLVLIQGAFSHLAFSHGKDNPFGSGALHPYVDRVRGPLVATYSVFDYAVCRWYAKASFLARDDLEGQGDPTRWDGMGADGFQAVDPLKGFSLLAEGQTEFDLKPHIFYRVDSAWVINDVDQSAFSGAHSDIRKVPIGQLAAAAAGAHA